MSIIEESMIINRLISPLKTPIPSPTHLNPKQIEVQVSKPNSRKSSKTNLLEIQTLKNVDQHDSDNVVNPMSSQVDLSQDENKENDIDLKQVLTEDNDNPSIEEHQKPKLIISKDSNIQMRQHKQIFMSKQMSPSPPPVEDKKFEDNLREIYIFYSKQAVTTNKYNTFEKLQQLSSTMILQKFMFFCKDFQLIDLEITNELIISLGGSIQNQPKKKKPQFKFNHKSNFILTKFYLVEVYKKNANKQMELTFQTFLVVINKLALLIFPNQHNLLFEFMGLKNPKIYRKKMTIIGKPFNSKEQNEVLTQEKLYERKILLPPKPRYASVKRERESQDVSLPKINRTTRCQVNSPPNKRGTSLKWEDLNEIAEEFDAKQFILDQDLSDKEDDYYLKEYQLNSKRRLIEINKTPQASAVSYLKYDNRSNNSKNYMLTSGNTRPSINKSFEDRKKSNILTPQTYQMMNKRSVIV